jgi:putative hemolysin
MKQLRVVAALSACMLVAVIAIAQEPATNVDPRRHGNLAAAQQLARQAFDKISAAQEANEFDLGGHAANAKEFLRQANEEIKLAAIAACVDCVAPAAIAQAPSNAATVTTLSNPASKFCVDKGGTLTLEKNGQGGQFGVCMFADNGQCEEWALMRGECRAGGIKVTGYATPAARYCAITGGAYKITSGSNTANENGSCTFKGGKTCASTAYFNGTCQRDQVQPTAATKQIRALFACDAGKKVSAIFINGPQSSVKLTLSDGRVLSLPQTMSGSGARYASADERVVFWNKGNTAFIEENGKTTYSGCATKP